MIAILILGEKTLFTLRSFSSRCSMRFRFHFRCMLVIRKVKKKSNLSCLLSVASELSCLLYVASELSWFVIAVFTFKFYFNCLSRNKINYNNLVQRQVNGVQKIEKAFGRKIPSR